jgi:hypothetical protein
MVLIRSPLNLIFAFQELMLLAFVGTCLYQIDLSYIHPSLLAFIVLTFTSFEVVSCFVYYWHLSTKNLLLCHIAYHTSVCMQSPFLIVFIDKVICAHHGLVYARFCLYLGRLYAQFYKHYANYV